MAVAHLLGLVLALDGAGATPASLVVSTGEDALAPCPAAGLLASTLRRRLPAVRVAVDASLGEGDLGVSLRARGDRWRLQVEGPAGQSMLAREIRPPEPSCAAVAETATIILDRYLTAIDWHGEEPRLQPASLALSAVGGGRPGGTRLALGAGLAAWTELPAAPAPVPALAVDLSVHFGRAMVGLWGAVPAVQRMTVLVDDENRGTLLTRHALLGGSLGACGAGPRLRLCAGVLAAAALVAGSAQGALFAQRPARSLAPAAGGLGRVIWALPWGFEVQLDAAALAPLGTAQVGVEGTAAVRRTARLYGLLGGRLAWRTP
jgi:hypothetical protein